MTVTNDEFLYHITPKSTNAPPNCSNKMSKLCTIIHNYTRKLGNMSNINYSFDANLFLGGWMEKVDGLVTVDVLVFQFFCYAKSRTNWILHTIF